MAFNIANYEYRGVYVKYTTGDTLVDTEFSNYFAHTSAPLRGATIILVVASDGAAFYDYGTAPPIRLADVDPGDILV